MVLNSDFVLLHKQSPLDRRAWAELLDMSAQEASYIDRVRARGRGAAHSRRRAGAPEGRLPEGRLYDLFNTKPEEIAAKKRESDFAERERRRKSEKGDV